MIARFVLGAHPEARQRAADYIAHKAPDGSEVIVRELTRNSEQNAKFHALCSDLAGKEWAGKPRSATEWKVLLVSGHAMATKIGADMVPGLEGEFVNLRESTARMSKSRMSSLIDYAEAFVAQSSERMMDRSAA